MKKYTYEVKLTLKYDVEAESEDIAMEVAELDFEQACNYLKLKDYKIEIESDEMYGFGEIG